MYKNLLEQFFKENSVRDEKLPSAAALAHFQIKLLLEPEVGSEIRSFMDEAVFSVQPNREESVLAEKNEIESAMDCKQILRFMRRHIDPMNQHILVKQAIAFEDQIIPEIIKMLQTSLNNVFIETAARVLSVCGKNTAEELIEYFNDVRKPYAQSVILVVLGFKADETHIPWLIEKYKELKRDYPNESYSDGAYYALYEIESRFYPAGKK